MGNVSREILQNKSKKYMFYMIHTLIARKQQMFHVKHKKCKKTNKTIDKSSILQYNICEKQKKIHNTYGGIYGKGYILF